MLALRHRFPVRTQETEESVVVLPSRNVQLVCQFSIVPSGETLFTQAVVKDSISASY